MDNEVDYGYIRFEWDSDKNASNLIKHGITFDVALYAFFDDCPLSKPHQIVDGEQRWRTIGMIDGCIVVFIGHLVDEIDDTEVIRIITARKAEKHEEREYYDNRKRYL